jgi:succinyl-CoA synthetase alpha subunit
MSILVDKNTRLLVCGLGKVGQFYTDTMVEYGTNVVGGTRLGKGGTEYNGIPVFNNAAEARAQADFNAAVVFVPAAGAAAAAIEAAESGAKIVVIITEGIPVADMVKTKAEMKERFPKVTVIGPNCPGIISPGSCKIGIMPGYIHTPGPVGIISRSGTLTYEAVYQCTTRNVGQSTCIGIGGDPVVGTQFKDLLFMFENDPGTKGVIMIGEIGGSAEEEAAELIRRSIKKPVVAYIAGKNAPPGKRMGHAGAIISGGKGTAAEKVRALKQAGVAVVESPAEMGVTMESLLKERKLI